MGKTREKKEREGEAVLGSRDCTWIKIYDTRAKKCRPDKPQHHGGSWNQQADTTTVKQKSVFTGPNLQILYLFSYRIPYNVPEFLRWHELPFKIRKKVLFFLSFIVEDYNNDML